MNTLSLFSAAGLKKEVTPTSAFSCWDSSTIVSRNFYLMGPQYRETRKIHYFMVPHLQWDTAEFEKVPCVMQWLAPSNRTYRLTPCWGDFVVLKHYLLHRTWNQLRQPCRHWKLHLQLHKYICNIQTWRCVLWFLLIPFQSLKIIFSSKLLCSVESTFVLRPWFQFYVLNVMNHKNS